MQLIKKQTYDGWIEIGEGTRLKIDYPTVEQKDFLDSILFATNLSMEEINTGIKDPDKRTEAQYLDIKYQRQYLRFTVKDWEGITDSESKEVKCILKNNELDEDLWRDMMRSLTPTELLSIYLKINKEIGFNSSDKKKLNLEDTSTSMENSKEKEKNIRSKSKIGGQKKKQN